MCELFIFSWNFHQQEDSKTKIVPYWSSRHAIRSFDLSTKHSSRLNQFQTVVLSQISWNIFHCLLVIRQTFLPMHWLLCILDSSNWQKCVHSNNSQRISKSNIVKLWLLLCLEIGQNGRNCFACFFWKRWLYKQTKYVLHLLIIHVKAL